MHKICHNDGIKFQTKKHSKVDINFVPNSWVKPWSILWLSSFAKFQNFTIEYIALYLNNSLKHYKKWRSNNNGKNIATMSEKSHTFWLINAFYTSFLLSFLSKGTHKIKRRSWQRLIFNLMIPRRINYKLFQTKNSEIHTNKDGK